MMKKFGCFFLILLCISPVFAGIQEVIIIPFSHLDIGFTATPQEVSEQYATLFDGLLEILRKLPDYSFTVESFWQFQQWLRNASKEELEKIKTYVQQGRLEFTANFANMHTGFQNELTLYETVACPIRKLKKLGIDVQVCMQDDVPGFTADLPDVLADLGIKYLIIGLNDKFSNVLTLPGPSHIFYWEGPRGGRVLTYVTKRSYMEGILIRSAAELEQIVSETEKSGYKYNVLPLLAASDNGGYEPGVMALIRLARTYYEKLRVTVSTPSAFFKKIERDYGNSFPTYRGDWSGWWEITKTGCPYSSGMVRWGQDALEDLLKTGTISINNPYYDAIVEKLLLFTEHTASCGAGWPGLLTLEQTEISNKTVVEYAANAYSLLMKFLRSTFLRKEDAIPVFCRSNKPIKTTLKVPVILQGDHVGTIAVNDQQFKAWSFSEPSTDAYEPFAQGLKARVVLKPGLNYLQIGDFRKCNFPRTKMRIIENDFYRIELNADLTFDVFDKELGTLVLKSAGRVTRRFTGKNNESPPLILNADNVVVTNYPGEKILEIDFSKGSVIKTIRITLPIGEKIFYFDCFVDKRYLPHVSYNYHSVNYFVAFPLVNVQSVSYQGPCTVVNNPFEFPSVRPNEISINGLLIGHAHSHACVIASREAFMVETTRDEGGGLKVNFHLLRHYSEMAAKSEGVVQLSSVEPGTPNILRFSFFFTSLREPDLKLAQEFLHPPIVIVPSN